MPVKTPILASLMATGLLVATSLTFVTVGTASAQAQPPATAATTQAPAMSVDNSPETPEEFLGKVYGRYRAGGPALRDASAELMQRVFDYSLLQLSKSLTPQQAFDAMDFDPICNCQENGVSNLKVDTVKSQGDQISVIATFKNFDEDKRVFFDLVRRGKMLKISNIRGSSYNLREDYQAELNYAKKSKP